MNFRTRIDFTDRQAKQYEKTGISLSGASTFGLPYSALTSGPDLTMSAITFENATLQSTYSGNTGTTVYTWGDPRMSIDEGDLSALTPSNSGVTQYAGPTWAGYNMFTTVDGYTGWTSYSAVTYDLTVGTMVDLGGGAYSGIVESDFIVYSATSVDWTGSTIWVDVSGITRTDELVVTKGAVAGYVLTAQDSSGKIVYTPVSAVTSGDTYITGSSVDCASSTISLERSDGGIINTDITCMVSGATIWDKVLGAVEYGIRDTFGDHTLTSADWGIVAGGSGHTINGSTYGGILGGAGHTISGYNNTVIAAGYNITADADDTLFTENLTLRGESLVHSDTLPSTSLTSIINGSTTFFDNNNKITGAIYSNGAASGSSGVIVGDYSNYPTIKANGRLGYYGTGYTRSGSPTVGADFYQNKIVISGSEDVAGMVIKPRSSNDNSYLWFEINGESVGKLSKVNGFWGFGMDNTGIEDATAHVQIGGTGTTGTFRFIDGNEAAGKVMVSDANGNASWGTVSGSTFTGNTSGDCITDLWVSNLHGCSPITFHDSVDFDGSTVDSGITYSFVFGNAHILTGSSATMDANTILGGTDNMISPFQTGLYNTIIGGSGNEIGGVSRVDRNTIIGSTDSYIYSVFGTNGGGFIGGGKGNTVGGSSRQSIIGGLGNAVTGTSSGSFIGGGNSNVITQQNSFIGGGQGNNINDFNAAIIGGLNNSVTAQYGAVIAGQDNLTSGVNALTSGDGNVASADAAVAFGTTSTASTAGSFAVGVSVHAGGLYAQAMGWLSEATGSYSHAVGVQTSATGTSAHAFGYQTNAWGDYSHSQGRGTTASGDYSHAQGRNTVASSDYSHAEGWLSQATTNVAAHAEGYDTRATGAASHAEGNTTIASGAASHAEGVQTVANANYTHAEGYQTSATTQYAHAEGRGTHASGDNSHAEGYLTTASGQYSHAQGSGTIASGTYAHAEGQNTRSTNQGSHAEGGATSATTAYAHAEGQITLASGVASHAEGYNTIASGGSAHAEGINTVAGGQYTHAEGADNDAYGYASHAEGSQNYVSGYTSHVGGNQCSVIGDYSFVHGFNSSATGDNIAVFGSGISATTSNTVYVPDLIIDGLNSTDPLATNANGLVVAGASDARLKTNIQDLPSALDKVKALRGVSFEWTPESNMGAGVTKFGLIAQEVKEVIPDMVRERSKGDGMLTLSYTEVVPWLIEAIKELDNKKLVSVSGDTTSEIKTDEYGRWIATPALSSKHMILPEFTPTSTNDERGMLGDSVWDDDYIYIKTNDGWKRSSLENF